MPRYILAQLTFALAVGFVLAVVTSTLSRGALPPIESIETNYVDEYVIDAPPVCDYEDMTGRITAAQILNLPGTFISFSSDENFHCGDFILRQLRGTIR